MILEPTNMATTKKKERLISVKMCSSATCQGSETGCSNGDCLTSTHHGKNARWRKMTLKMFRYLFEREPK